MNGEQESEYGVRDYTEVKQASEVLLTVLARQSPIQINRNQERYLEAVLDTLCWVMNHGHRTEFAEVLSDYCQRLKSVGMVYNLPEFHSVNPLPLLPDRWRQEVVKNSVTLEQAREEIRAFYAGQFKRYRILVNACKVCGKFHEPHGPHDLSSPVYRCRCLALNGLLPSWEDALEHCPESLQRDVMTRLIKLDEWPYFCGRLRTEVQTIIKEAVKKHQPT